MAVEALGKNHPLPRKELGPEIIITRVRVKEEDALSPHARLPYFGTFHARA